MTNTIQIIDQHSICRLAYRALIQPMADFEIIAESADVTSAINDNQRLLPDIIIVDFFTAHSSELAFLQRILQQNTAVKIIICSCSKHQRKTRPLMQLAFGLVCKGNAEIELVLALEKVAQGQRYFCSAYAKKLAHEDLHQAEQHHFHLTLREQQVFAALLKGGSAKGIADELKINPKTVRTHKLNLMRKLNVKNMIELAKFNETNTWSKHMLR